MFRSSCFLISLFGAFDLISGFGLDDAIDFSADMCYRITYTRGVGKVLQCDPNSDHPSYDAGLCYEQVILSYQHTNTNTNK